MTTQSLRERRAERERKAREQRARIQRIRERNIAKGVSSQPQNVVQPSDTPFIPQGQQAQVQADLNAQRTASTPLGKIGIGAGTAAPETRGKPEFGSFFGSGILENVAGGVLPALENAQKFMELVGGTADSIVDLAPGSLFASQNEGRGFSEILQEVSAESGRGGAFDVAGQAQNLAEAFRRTNQPTKKFSLPGEGIPLPGGRKFDDFDIGVKGATELIPEVLLGIATGGSSTGASLGRKTATSILDALGRDIAKGTIKVTAKTTRQAIKVARQAPEVAGKASRVNYSGALNSISNVNQPGVAAALKGSTKIPSSFKGPISAFLNAASPARFADTSRGAIHHMLAYAKVLDGLDAITDIDIAVLAKARLASGLKPTTAYKEGAAKVDSVPFTVGEGSTIHNTGIPEIDAGHEVTIKSGDRKGEVVRIPYTTIEIQENFFDYKGKVPKGSKAGTPEYDAVVLARDKMRDKYGGLNIGVWDEPAQRYGGDASLNAPWVNPAEDVARGTFIPNENALSHAEQLSLMKASPDETVTLFHVTTKEGARAILKSGEILPSRGATRTIWGPGVATDPRGLFGGRRSGLSAEVVQFEVPKSAIDDLQAETQFRGHSDFTWEPSRIDGKLEDIPLPILNARVFDQSLLSVDKNAADLATYVRLNQDTYKAQGLMAVSEGMSPKKIKTTTKLDYVSSHYAPKNADGSYLYDDQLHALGAVRSGATPGRAQKFMKERKLKTDEIDELRAKGEYGYLTPDESMREFVRGMKKGSLDAQHQKALKETAQRAGSGIVDFGKAKQQAKSAAITLGKGLTKSGKLRIVHPKTIRAIRDAGLEASAGVLEKASKSTRKNAKDRNDIIAKVKAALLDDVEILGDKTFIPTRRGAAKFKQATKLSTQERMPAYTGLIYENRQEVARLVKQHYPKDDLGRLESFTNVLSEISDVIRLGKTGFDFGYHMIQGLPALGAAAAEATKITSRTIKVQGAGGAGKIIDTAAARRARGRAKLKVWAKSTVEMAKAFTDQDRMMASIADDVDLFREAVGNNLQMAAGSTDVFQAIRNGSILKRIPKVGEAIDARLAKLADPFQRAFLAPSDYIRFQYYKIDRETAMLAGLEGLTDPIEIAAKQQSNLQELAGSLNNMTGALSSAGMGINPTLNTVERGIIAFSARYTRSSIALLSDVFKGNIRGEKARNSLAGLVGLGMVSYISMVEAMNLAGLKQEVKLDPTKSDFMTFDLGGDRVGFGGFWTQFSKLSSRVAETAWDEDAREMFLGDDTLRTNPIIRWLRGRSAPGAGVIWDGMMQEDYLGRDIEGVVDWTKHVGRQAVPIWVEAGVLGSPYKTGWVGTPFELVGGRVNPLSSNDRRRELRDSVAIDAYGAKWTDINGLQRDKISSGEGEISLSDFEELQRLDAEVAKGTVERGDLTDIVVEKYKSKRLKINDEFNVKIQEGRDYLTAGSIDLPTFRTLYLSEANSTRRVKLEELHDSEGEFAEAIAYFEGNAKRFGEDKPEDIAYNEFITTIIATDEFEDPMGLDWEAKEEAVEIFQAKWGGEVYAYILERFGTGRDLDAVVYEIYKGKQHFNYYWGDTERATLASMPNSSALQEAYREYKNATDNRQFDMRETVPYLKEFIAKLSRVKKAMRETDVDLDRWMFRMGYSNPLVHPENEFSPDGVDDAREYWRDPHPMPLQTFGIPVGTTL